MCRAAVAVLMGLCVAGVLAGANAQSPETITMSQAVAQFGTPSYDRNCENGTITLAWKRSEAVETWPMSPGLRRAQARSAMESRGLVARKSTLVMKFDAEGRLVWARQVR